MSMMPLAGVQLTAQGYAPFMAAMANASSAVSRFGTSVGGIGGAMTGANQQTNQFTLGTASLAVAIGNLASGAIQTAIAKTTEFVQTSIGAVMQMQDLQINLETLSAREYLYANATDDMNVALKMGAGNAEYMLNQLEKLSIKSPFQYEQIISVFQMNMAFGQSSEMALKLTQAITNLGAVNKGIPGILQRLSYNFSQMSMVGKISARDTRDLAMAGLDLNKVLKLQLGKTMKEVNDEMASGKMTFKDVSTALIDYTDKYIGPAAERASKTLGGLQSTLKDVTFFAGANLFKQAADTVAGALSQMLDKVLSFVNSDSFKAAGMTLAVFAQQIVNAMGMGERAISGIATDFATIPPAAGAASAVVVKSAQEMAKSTDEAEAQMGKAMIRQQDAARAAAVFNKNEFYMSARDAVKWGVDLIVNYADGIMQGGMGFLQQAMNWIRDMLTSWLQPHSPPQVAPDIDIWGMQTMGEWLKGFTEADFGVLDSIRGELQKALSFAGTAGLIEKADIGKIMVEWSDRIIDVMNSGKGLQSLLGDIANTVGPFGSQIAKLVEENFALATATKEAEKAQKALTEAQKAEYNAGKNVSRQVKEYNDMVRKGASKEALKAKMAEINASRDQQVAASKSRIEAEKNMETSGASLNALKEQIALQGKLVSTLLELGNARIAAAQEGGGGKAPAGGPPDSVYTMPPPPDVSFFGEEMTNAINEEIQYMFGSLIEKWTNGWKVMKVLAWLQWSNFVDEMEAKFGTPITSKVTEIMTTLNNVFGPMLANLWAIIQNAWTTITNTWNAATATLSESWGYFVMAFSGLNFNFEGTLQFLSVIVQVVFGFIVDAITRAVGLIIVIVTSLINGILVGMTWFMGILGAVQYFMTGAWNGIVKAFTDPTITIPERLMLIINAIGNFLAGVFTMMFAGLALIIGVIVGFALNFFNAGVALFQGLSDGAKSMWKNVWETITGAIQGAIDKTKELLGIKSPSTVFSDIGIALLQGLIDGITGLITTVGTTIQSVVDTITGYATTFATAGASLLQGLSDGINGAVAGVIESAVSAAEGVIAAVKAALGIKSPSTVFMKIGVQADEGMAIGFEKNAESPDGSAKAASEAVVQAYNNMHTMRNSLMSQMASMSQSSVRGPLPRGGGGAGIQVTIQVGDVSISNKAEGDMFQRRIELAVMNALGAG